MSHPVLRLFDGLDASAPFRFDQQPVGGTAREVGAIREDLEKLHAQGVEWVALADHEPQAHPRLPEIVRILEELGLRARMTTTGVGLAERDRLERLRDGGVAQLTLLAFGGEAATHDAHVGREGSFADVLEAAELAHKLNRMMVIVRYVLLRDNVDEVATLIAKVGAVSDRVELVRLTALTEDRALLREHGVPRRLALGAVQAAWEAARENHTKLVTEAFATWPEIPMPSESPVQPADGTLLELLRGGVPVPSTTNGTWATPVRHDVRGLFPAVESARGLQELGLLLSAWGAPALDLPPEYGGLGLSVPPGTEDAPLERVEGVPAPIAKVFGPGDPSPLPAWVGVGRSACVHVVNGPGNDGLLALSTFPSLARRLQELGASVVHHTAWAAPFNPHDREIQLADHAMVPSDDPTRPGMRFPLEVADAFATTPARHAHVVRQTKPWMAALDFSGADLVVAGGWETALAVADHPTLPPGARLVVCDFHLMAGLPTWHERWLRPGARPMDGGWWPDPRFEVHALFPRSARVYWRSGVPLKQVSWRPYPIELSQLPHGPDPRGSEYLVAGGSHQRDWPTLARAMSLLGPTTRPMAVYTKDAVPAPLQSGGEIRLLHFYEALANARFVVLPLVADPRRPAGISAAAMALAAGRPIIASCTLGTVDHLHHGVNAILVPPGDPHALAAAIRRLDSDDALLDRLAAGARASAEASSVERWALDLLDGAPPVRTWPTGENLRGPYRPWSA